MGQFTNARERGGGGGFAANAVAANPIFRFTNFFVGHVEHKTVGETHALQRLFPGTRIADADGGGYGFRLRDGLEFGRADGPHLRERISAGGLHNHDARRPFDEAKLFHFHESFAEGRGIAEIAAGDHQIIRQLAN